MSLINSEQVKEYLYENFDGIQCYDGSGADIYKEIEEIIDDTPAVCPEEFKPLIDKIVELLPKIVNEVIEQQIRPKGEWIDTNNVGANNWCSVCGEFILHYNGICNFCSNCGADMRGEE